MTDLLSKIEGGELLPVYVLAGDAYLQELVERALRAAAVPKHAAAFNLEVIEGKEGGAATILNAARTLPMMAERRLVLVRRANELGKALADLVPYLDNPSPSTVLVLALDKIDGRLKFFQAAKKHKFVHELGIGRNVGAWVEKEAERTHVRIERDAVRRLVDVVGAEPGRLAASLAQLSLYAHGRSIVSADVDELVADTRERTVFELAEAVGEGDPPRALRAVAKLFAQRDSSVGVAMMLARHFRQLFLAKELAGARVSDRELAPRLGVPPFVVPGLLEQSRRFSLPALRRAFAQLAQADGDLKGTSKSALGERVLLERLVSSLIALAR